jgi:predicted dehydrogenase
MADRFRWGILSTGHIAMKFVQDLALLADAEVAAVGSRSTEAAEAFATAHGIPRAHGSWQALAEDPEVDAIYVATPHVAHAEATLLCLRAGKPTLTEKPFTMDLRSSQMLVTTARERGVFLMEAMWMRCNPVIQRVQELVRQGVIGEPVSVHADFGLAGPFPQTHRLRALALGGGALLDLGIYPLTLTHLVLGAPASITAWARLGETGVDENTGALLGYASGAVAAITCSLVGDSACRAVITGTEGRIELPRNFYRPDAFDVYHGERVERVRIPFDGFGYHFEAAEVHRCVREGLLESPVVPLDDTLSIMSSLDTIRAAIGVRYDTDE